MESRNGSGRRISAARLTASAFGILAGLGGIRHGIGEVLQGNVAPDGLMIDSWTQGPIAAHMGGEPGMTIVPNLLITGVLAIVVSLAVIVWASSFVERRQGGVVLMLLSVTMLLVGGGIGPPVVGLLAGVAGMAIHARLTWWRTHLSPGVGRALARLWPWVSGVALVNGVFLFIVSIFLVVLGVHNAGLFLNSFYFAVISLILTIITGVGYDLPSRVRRVAARG